MAEPDVTIYHNPRCSKSRNALALLKGHGVEPTIVEYLKQPPDKAMLKSILGKLGIKPEQIVRRGEDAFKQNYKGKSLSDDEWIEALVQHPILIERPIVVSGERAVIGRPPENVLALV